MQLGLQIPDFTWPDGPSRLGVELAQVARTAEDVGFGYIGVMDHFFQIGMIGPPEHEMLEAYTTLGFLAAHTSRAKLLTLVTGVVYRHRKRTQHLRDLTGIIAMSGNEQDPGSHNARSKY